MDSSNWDSDRKAKAGRGYAEAHKRLLASPSYRAQRRKAAVAANLAVVVAQSDKTRTSVAQAADMKLAQLSRQLSGEINLTLDTVGRICDAVGWDFDVVFRQAEQPEAAQPWQRPAINRATVLQLVRARYSASSGENAAVRQKLVACEPADASALAPTQASLELEAA